jgi:type I restriction enzyme S subunit
VLEVARWYLDSGLGDADAELRLASKNDAIYWQQLSEILIANELFQAGLAPSRKPSGPDFLIVHQGRRIWIEVICPKPNDIPNDWLETTNGAVSFPHEAIILRWTSAIKEKFEKLTGKPDRPETGYLAKGVVAPDDSYVIAVNGRLLRNLFPQISGISQYPFAVEVTLAVGPLSIHIDRNTLKTAWSGLHHRPLVQKPNGALVPADTFFDPGYVPVSGVWAADFDENVLFESVLFGASKPSILAHNHAASNPLPALLLPVHSEYRATVGTEEYTVDRVDGLLAIAGRSP